MNTNKMNPLLIAACSLLIMAAACKKEGPKERQNITVDAKYLSFTTNSIGEPRGLGATFDINGQEYFVSASIGSEILSAYPGSFNITNLDFIADNSIMLSGNFSEACAIKNPTVPNSIRYNLEDDPNNRVYTENSEFASVLVNITPATEFYFGGRKLYETYNLRQMDSASLAAAKQISALHANVYITKH